MLAVFAVEKEIPGIAIELPRRNFSQGNEHVAHLHQPLKPGRRASGTPAHLPAREWPRSPWLGRPRSPTPANPKENHMATLFPAVQPAPSEAFQAQAPRAFGALDRKSAVKGNVGD